VLVTDIDEAAARNTAQGITEAGGQAKFHRVDIGSLEQIESAVKSVAEEFGRIDVLVNNAAYIGAWHGVLHATDEEWDGCLRATLLGTQRFT
jgi:NAD(P)-dependent dehydrogenase (short-subunit alcohol dehydrogenase family)